MDYYSFVAKPAFFSFLLEIDRSTAEEAHKRPCLHCGGKLDRGNFMRAGYGLPAASADETKIRFSFCCREDGCRKRFTPPSMRFFRGVAYVSIVVVLLAAINHGLSPKRAQYLTSTLKVSRQTIKNWVRWWHENFAKSSFWRAARGRFGADFDDSRLPWAIITAFLKDPPDGQSECEAALNFLKPYLPNFAGG